MQQVNSLSLMKIQGATDLSQARSEVVLNGNNTGIIVPGEILEAAVLINEQRYVLFLTDDVIFEESLTVALIDLREGIKEVVRVGNEYATGYFEALSVTADSISFRFIGEYLWTVTVSDIPRFRLPFVSDPQGVKRDTGFKKYMDISVTRVSGKARS
ncbi:hypothetical protein SMZ82_000575 [Cronobacter malonaticus]|uniref:hypothetical protein n=1 Tax=Cronobacter malonaticus TaxID=413503 RepID=UPI00051890D1|nr:hypothetical protein [Cronobacter malonaticus]EGT4383214.1 hypothetical protein [Cronobacter malonaticus]EGT4420798.1 hypothetical protein [Cronobacter malonaticus]EGT4445332.1 hypothetical protein [Cronobacter malonaticus]EGT4456197.1 hypothetical protein [Cronobacter malonaticus]EKP4390055.1 hypothetical protein [Cronobacter malonaticus]